MSKINIINILYVLVEMFCSEKNLSFEKCLSDLKIWNVWFIIFQV